MNIYITFDYELFLGPKTGSVENCLIRPTERYLELADRLRIRYIFFVDVLYLLKLREYMANHEALEKDYHQIVNQLSEAARKGHDIQLHLHPQWFYSTYSKNGWKQDFKHYKLDDCPIEDVAVMIERGCEMISEISSKRPIVYRAGGYSFPSNNQIVKLLHNNGITLDSSTVMFSKAHGIFQQYDYSEIRTFDTYNFNFQNSQPMIGTDYAFTEYPVSCCRVPWLLNTLEKRMKLWRYRGEDKRIYGDGTGVGLIDGNESGKSTIKLKRMISMKIIRASIDFTNATNLQLIYRKAKRANSNTMVIIGHPKNTTNVSLVFLEKFVKANSLSTLIKTIGI